MKYYLENVYFSLYVSVSYVKMPKILLAYFYTFFVTYRVIFIG